MRYSSYAIFRVDHIISTDWLWKHLCLDINAVDNEGNTPLHLASEKSKQEVVKHLLVNGADGNIRNNKQWAAIHVATLLNNADIIKVRCNFMAKKKLKYLGTSSISEAGRCQPWWTQRQHRSPLGSNIQFFRSMQSIGIFGVTAVKEE